MKETKSTLPEQIITVKQFHESVFKEKGSEFIAQVYPIQNTEDVIEFLDTVRKKYYDATHNCFAYKYLNETQKYSDDGEPSGTAGIRILNAIEHFNLTNVLVVVTRYFGGTKLGVGPLGKAYFTAALDVLEASKKQDKFLFEKLTVKMDISAISQLYRIVSTYKGKIEKSDFSDRAIMEVIIPPTNIISLKNELIETLRGSVEIIPSGIQFYE